MSAGVGHVVATPLPTMPSLPGGGAGGGAGTSGGGLEQLFDVQEDGEDGTEMPVGIHVAEDALRMAGWDAAAGKATALPADADSADGSLRACACYVRPGQVLLGDDVDPAWRQQPHHTLLRPVRLLGRSFSSLGGARWLADEEAHTPCSLVPDADETSYSSGRARFRLSHDRAASDLRKRTGASARCACPAVPCPARPRVNPNPTRRLALLSTVHCFSDPTPRSCRPRSKRTWLLRRRCRSCSAEPSAQVIRPQHSFSTQTPHSNPNTSLFCPPLSDYKNTTLVLI